MLKPILNDNPKYKMLVDVLSLRVIIVTSNDVEIPYNIKEC